MTKSFAIFLFACLVPGAVGQPAAPAAQPPMGASLTGMDKDLFEVSVAQLESFYASHKYTVSQVVQWHLARIHRYNGIYKPIEQVLEKEALAAATKEDAADANAKRGPLWGVPIVIKANTSIAGQVTTDGWAGYTLPGHELFAPKDATVVARLRAAGAILIGHTNMPDFAASDTNRSSSFGRTGNAYDVRFSPGGSSGGTVTAVTSNMALLGTGTDTGNSIRMPAATSAVIGVFPTRGLVPIAGIAPLDWLLDNTGPIARNVTDAAIALDVIAGLDWKGKDEAGKPTADPLDARTADAPLKAQPGPYTRYLKPDALKGQAVWRPGLHSAWNRCALPGHCRRCSCGCSGSGGTEDRDTSATGNPGSLSEGARRDAGGRGGDCLRRCHFAGFVREDCQQDRDTALYS